MIARSHLQSGVFVGFGAVSPPPLNEVPGKDSNLLEGEDLFPQNGDSSFLNMAPRDLNTLDVTGLPCLEATCAPARV